MRIFPHASTNQIALLVFLATAGTLITLDFLIGAWHGTPPHFAYSFTGLTLFLAALSYHERLVALEPDPDSAGHPYDWARQGL